MPIFRGLQMLIPMEHANIILRHSKVPILANIGRNVGLRNIRVRQSRVCGLKAVLMLTTPTAISWYLAGPFQHIIGIHRFIASRNFITTDMTVDETGFKSVLTNLAEVQNSGFELSATYQKRLKDFHFSIGGNMSHIQNNRHNRSWQYKGNYRCYTGCRAVPRKHAVTSRGKYISNYVHILDSGDPSTVQNSSSMTQYAILSQFGRVIK